MVKKYLYFGEDAPAGGGQDASGRPTGEGAVSFTDMIKNLGSGFNIPGDILSEAEKIDQGREADTGAGGGAGQVGQGSEGQGGTGQSGADGTGQSGADGTGQSGQGREGQGAEGKQVGGGDTGGDAGGEGGQTNEQGQQKGGQGQTNDKGVIPIEVEMFGSKKKIGGSDAGAGVENGLDFSKPEVVVDYVKQNWGDDVPGFFGKVKELEQTAEKAEKIESDYKNVVRAIEMLPEELYELNDAYWNGRDWKSLYNQKTALDFSKKFDEHNMEDVIEHFYPGQFKEDDYEDITDNKALQIAVTEAKNKYNNIQQQHEQKRVQYLQNVEQHNKAYGDSVNKAIAKLEKDFPEVGGSVKQKIVDYLRRGNFNDLIYNDDRTLNEGAAVFVMLRNHGVDAIRNLEKALRSQIEGEVNEEILKRGKKTPDERKPGGGTQEGGRSEATKKQMEAMAFGLVGGNTY